MVREMDRKDCVRVFIFKVDAKVEEEEEGYTIQSLGKVMFNGPFVVLCITHTYIVSIIVCADSVDSGANRP